MTASFTLPAEWTRIETIDAHTAGEPTVGNLPAIVPVVTGSAHITGRHEFFIDPGDPLRDGFFLR
jgi:proline racemase